MTIDMTGTETENTNKYSERRENGELDNISHCEICDELEASNSSTGPNMNTSFESSDTSPIQQQTRQNHELGDKDKCEKCNCESSYIDTNYDQKNLESSYKQGGDNNNNEPINEAVESQLLDNKSDSCLVIAASTTNIAVSTSVRSPMANANSIHGFCSAAEVIESRRERKAAKTLAIITGVFVMCWLPFFIMAILMPLLDLKPHKYLFGGLLWLGYINSMLNPIIYTIFSPDFRKAFKRLIGLDDHSVKRRNQRRQISRTLSTHQQENKTKSNCIDCLPQSLRRLFKVYQ